MTTSTQSLLNTIDELKASGVTPKVTVLKTRKPRKSNLYANRIKGGSTRVRCDGGSRSTSVSGSNSALTDVR